MRTFARMFAADCRECRKTVLSTVLAVVPAPAGNIVLFRCRCGAVDAELIERTREPA